MEGLDARTSNYGSDEGRRAQVYFLVSELPAAGLAEGEIFEITEKSGTKFVRVRAVSIDNYGGAVMRVDYRDEMSEGAA